MRIIDEAGADPAGLSLAVAAALHYRKPSELLDDLLKKEDVVEVLKRVSGLSSDSKLLDPIMNFYYELETQIMKNKFNFAQLLLQ